jgi:hypothetical protein
MKLLPARPFNPGDKRPVDREEKIEQINFTVHKFTPRKRPENPANVVIFPHFSEFGSELVESLYCLPMSMRTKYVGKYSIVMGWYGRAYLYKHLVDEFWEIKQEHQWLRDYCRAFHHDSVNLKKAEKQAGQYGTVADINDYAIHTLHPRIQCCTKPGCGGQIIYTDQAQYCLRCHSQFPRVGIYHEIKYAKDNLAVWTPQPSKEKLAYVDKYLKPNSVGVTARFRNCYGRNLPKEFYELLVLRLEAMGYNPIWIGEKETTLRSPFERITDFCITEDARDLETTLALVSKLKFTVQFWTASTRLAGLVGTPYLLFESPEQIWGVGQEGIRLNLCTKGKRKLVLAHYLNVLNRQAEAVDVVEKAVREMEAGNYDDLMGMVDHDFNIKFLRQQNKARIGD